MQFKSPFSMQNAAKATGNGAPMEVAPFSSAALQITGTFVGTIAFEASVDNVNYVPIIGKRVDKATQVTTTTETGLYVFNVRGIQFIRARISAYTSGEITIVGVASEAPFGSPEADFVTATLQAAAAANGNGTAMDVQGYASVLFNVTGTFGGTVTFQGSADGTNYFGLQVQNMTDASQASTTTAAGLFSVGVNGLRKIRAVVSNYSSGAVTVTATALPIANTPLTTATLTATVENVTIKNAAGTNTLEPDADGQIGVKVNGSLPAFAATPNVAVSSAFDTLRPMLGATKTASGVASEAFAGVARKAGRRGLAIKNEHPYLRLRLDGAAVTDTTGIALEPFTQAIFEFDPAVDVPVYVISEAGLVKYGVVEW